MRHITHSPFFVFFSRTQPSLADAIEQKTALWSHVREFSVFKLSDVAVVSTLLASATYSGAGAIELGRFHAFFARSLSDQVQLFRRLNGVVQGASLQPFHGHRFCRIISSALHSK